MLVVTIAAWIDDDTGPERGAPCFVIVFKTEKAKRIVLGFLFAKNRHHRRGRSVHRIDDGVRRLC